MVVGATRENSKERDQVIDGMKKIYNIKLAMELVLMEHYVLKETANNPIIPSDIRNTVQKYVDQWEKVNIPKVIENINNIPDLPAKSKEWMPTAQESATRISNAILEANTDLTKFEDLLKTPNLRGSGEVAIATYVVERTIQKRQAENAARSRLLQIAPQELKMAMIRATLAMNAEDRKVVVSLRRQEGNSPFVIDTLKGIEMDIVIAMLQTAQAGMHNQFPTEFRYKMQDKAREYSDLAKSLTPEEPKDKIMLDLGNPQTLEEEIEGFKRIVEKLKKEVVDPKASKEKKEFLIAYLINIEGELEMRKMQEEMIKKGNPQGAADLAANLRQDTEQE